MVVSSDEETNEDNVASQETQLAEETIWDRKEIGGNGQSELKTKADVENVLKELNNIMLSNSSANYSDVVKAQNNLEAQKNKIETEQTEKKNSILKQFMDALNPNKEISNSVIASINELHDSGLQKQLKQEYEIFKAAEKEGEVAKPTIDFLTA